MRVAVDTIALSRRAHMFADRTIREMMKRSGLLLTGEDRDSLMRLASDAFSLGFLACVEDIENERAARDGAKVIAALQAQGRKAGKP